MKAQDASGETLRKMTLDTSVVFFQDMLDLAVEAIKRVTPTDAPTPVYAPALAALIIMVQRWWAAPVVELSDNRKAVSWIKLFGHHFNDRSMVAIWSSLVSVLLHQMREGEAPESLRQAIYALRDVQVWKLKDVSGILVPLDPLEGTIGAVWLHPPAHHSTFGLRATFATKAQAEAWRKDKRAAGESWRFYSSYNGEMRLT